MNIFGEGFPKEIIAQIETRQKVYGYGWNSLYRRTPLSHIYNNANTSWCKLVSSTDIINSDTLQNSNISTLGGYTGDDLAKSFILFNGTSFNESYSGRSGFNFNLDDQNNISTAGYNAYTTWGIPTADFGYRPMAGIQSVVVKHKNRGSIRTADVQIKAWDKISFEIIDVLYLRLGFSVLLEWGNSMYFNNSEEPQLINFENSLASDFLEANYTYSEFLKKISEKRIESLGNYDAMFGKVTNFNWAFNVDGSYDITLNLVSIGDVIESFKVKGNALTIPPKPACGNNNNVDLNTPSTQTVLEKYAKTSDISNYLYSISNVFTQGGSSVYSLREVNYSNVQDPSTFPFSSTSNIVDAVKIVNKSGFSPYASGDGSSDYDEYYFIRLGNLLNFIQDNVLYKIKNNSGTVPFLKFDTSIEDNLMHSPDQLMSYDPNICMVRRVVGFPSLADGGSGTGGVTYAEYFNAAEATNNVYTSAGTTNANDFMVPDTNLSEAGKIMNIYINFRFILSKLDELIDKDTNEIKLIDFLKEILSGINGAMGGYSKLDLFIDETTNTAKIIDQNPLPSIKQALTYISSSHPPSSPLYTEYALFELYGYSQREDISKPTGSDGNYPPLPYRKTTFIKDFKFKTELTPEFSTMISVAATSNGNVVGENNTALSRLNSGLRDKYTTEINGGGSTFASTAATPEDKSRENYNTAVKEYADFTNSLTEYLVNLERGIYVNNQIKDNKAAFTIFFKLYKKYQLALKEFLFYAPPGDPIVDAVDKNGAIARSFADSSFQPGTGFIPFNLSLTMDGLSGMKIGSKFLIDASYLPSNYPTTVDFLIKNLQHEIKDNKWTTTLESYCISQGSNDYVPIRLGTVPVDDTTVDDDDDVVTSTKTLKQIIIDAGYAEGTPLFIFAYAIGTKEGWDPDANGGVGSRSYRNNNPGNLDNSSDFKSIDSGVTLENNPYGTNRFAKFTTAELGAKVLVEKKIKKWASGNMPITAGNQTLIVSSGGGNKWIKSNPPTVAQFIYTYAPPNENDTENYIASVLKELKKIDPGVTRTSLIKDLI